MIEGWIDGEGQSDRVTGWSRSGGVAELSEVHSVGLTYHSTLLLVQGQLQSLGPLFLLLELVGELHCPGSA